MGSLWEIQMFGRLCARGGTAEVSRFRTRKSAELLAFLACFMQRAHHREVLLEQLWAEEDEAAARNRLSVELNSLRRQLEPPGIPAGSVLIADRSSIRLNPDACTTDTQAFEKFLKQAEQTESDAAKLPLLADAVSLYHGEFLSGFYSDWVLTEQERFRELHRGALRQLVRGWARAEQWHRALDYALLAVQADGFCEASCRDLMTLYVRVGQPASALEHFQQLEKALNENFGIAPAAPTRELAAKIQAMGVLPASSRTTSPIVPVPPVPSVPVSAPAPTHHSSFIIHHSASSLPPQFTRFFGRETEIQDIVRLLDQAETHLLTLTGMGGCGKTRLSLEVAAFLRAAGQERIWFVPLADIADPRYLTETLQKTLGLPSNTDADPLAAVVAFLAASPALLILDNFEQLLQEQETRDAAQSGSGFVQTLLARVPTLRCLVTSRQPLNLHAEQEFAVAPLPTPRKSGTPERLMDFSSVQLFVNRAQARRVDFQVTARNASAVAALCDHLEGIPLALELAAAWAKLLTPAQMVQQFQSRLSLLEAGRTDFPPRHRTMRAAIESSVRLLSLAMREFFARLSVFRGGWTLAAAEAICTGEEEEKREQDKAAKPDTLDSLLLLRNHSLIVTEETDDAMRFRMLETLRDYATECLTARGEADALRDRHADYFREWLTPTSAKLNSAEMEAADAQRELTAELENLRAGMDWTAQRNDAAKTIEYGLGLTRYLIKQGLYADCDLRLSVAIDAARQINDTKSLAGLLNRQGLSLWERNDYVRSRPFFQESYALSKQIGYTLLVLVSLTNLGNIAWAQSEFEEARRIWEEGLALAQEMGQPLREAAICDDLGQLAAFRGDFAMAETYSRRSQRIFRAEGYQEGMATSLAMHAESLWRQERRSEAIAQLEEALRQFRALGMARMLAYASILLGDFLRESGRFEEAELLILRGLESAQEMGLRGFVVQGKTALAPLRAVQGQIESAVELFQQAGREALELGDRKQVADILRGYGLLCLAQGAPEASYSALWLASQEYNRLCLTEASSVQEHLLLLESRLALPVRKRLEAAARHQSRDVLETMTPPPPRSLVA